MLEEVMLNLDKDGSGTLGWDEFKIAALQVALLDYYSLTLSLSESGKLSVLTQIITGMN